MEKEHQPIFFRPSLFISLMFLITVFYNGPGANLHILSVAWLVLTLWLTLIIVDQNASRIWSVRGWLPLLATAYVAWLVFAPSISTYSYVSSVQAAELLLLPIIFIAWLLETHECRVTTWDLTWHLLLANGVVLALWGISDFLVSQERAHGPLIDTNAYGALMNLLLIPILWNYFNTSRLASGWNSTYVQLVVIGSLALAEFMTLSRGALIAFLVMLPLLFWLGRKQASFGIRLSLLLLVLGGSYLFVKFGPVDPQQIGGAGVEKFVLNPEGYIERDGSLQTRLLLWKSTWDMISDSNMLVGRGLGTFKTFYPPYRREGELSLGNYAHNDYLQALLEGGLIQLIFIVAILVVAPVLLLLKCQIRSDQKNPAPGLLLGVLCVSVHAVVNFIHFVVPIALLSGLYLAACWKLISEPETR